MGSSNARRRNKQQRREYGEPIKTIVSTPITANTHGSGNLSAMPAPTNNAPQPPIDAPVVTIVEAPQIEPEPEMVDEVILPIRSSGPGNGTPTTHGRHNGQQTPTPASELTPLLESLRAIFVNDRAIGSRSDVGRCGICYLIFGREELHFHEEEGFYACDTCEAALGTTHLPMLHRQRK